MFSLVSHPVSKFWTLLASKINQIDKYSRLLCARLDFLQWRREGVWPGANVCVATPPAPTNQIGIWYFYGYNDGIGVDCENSTLSRSVIT